MRILTSPEFVDLCRAQVMLLSHSVGATSSSVYLTESTTDDGDAELIPIVTYPETSAWRRNLSLSLLPPSPEADLEETPYPPGSPDSPPRPGQPLNLSPRERGSTLVSARSQPTFEPGNQSAPPDQIVMPLIHQGTVVGLLVTVREDRPWNTQDHVQLESVARTLAIARFLDQRSQWFEHDLQEKRLFQVQQQETLHDLLHQFRNPLTALHTFGKLLLRRLKPDDANRKVAEGIVRESDRLRDLLDEFRATVDLEETEAISAQRLAALPSGEASLQPGLDSTIAVSAHDRASARLSPPLLPSASLWSSLELSPCSFRDILQPLLISADAIAQERNLSLQVDLPEGLPPVQGNAKALREVFSNLVDNALKYSPAGATVYVQAGLTQTFISLPDPASGMKSMTESQQRYQGVLIVDTGPGIPPQDLAHVFERHYRGVQSQTEIPGTGLGLAIAQELMHQMKGDIQVVSPIENCNLVPQAIQDALLDHGSGTACFIWLPELEDTQ